MTITISNTTKVVMLDGVPCRVWEGQTEKGIQVHCFIPRIAVKNGLDHTEFEEELEECRAPSADVEAIPARMIL